MRDVLWFFNLEKVKIGQLQTPQTESDQFLAVETWISH